MSDVIHRKSDRDSAMLKWTGAQQAENKAAELAAYEEYVKKSEDLQVAANQMLESIGESCGASPVRKSGYTRKPTTSAKNMKWMDGLNAQWKPRISFSDFDFRSYKTKDGTRYAAVNTVAAAGYTMPDGEVLIPFQLLIDAVMDKNPGVVAQALYHEGHHFSRLITSGWSYKEDEEISAYSNDILSQDAFELSDDWKNTQSQNLESNRAVLANRKTTAYALTKKEENEIKAVIDQQDIGQISLEKYYQDLKAAVEESRREQEEEERRTIDEILRRGREMRPAPLHPETPRDPSTSPAPLIPDRPARVIQPIKEPDGEDQITRLRVIALIACDPSRGISDQQLSKIDWSKLKGIPNIDRGLAGLSACEARVFSRLAQFARNWLPGAIITSADVRAAASGAAPPGSGGGGNGGGRDCFRNGDPFGCEHRH